MTPVTWEGWLFATISTAVVIATAILFHGWRQWAITGLVVLVAAIIAYCKTQGGWRWGNVK